MPTKNVVFSHITANLSANWTSIDITAWEWAMFQSWMIATIEQLNSEWKATAREVVLINWVSTDTLSITRAYEKCVMDDTASPKVMWNTKQSFTTWAKISVYVSKALLNWVQTRLSQVNCPCNTSVLNQALAMTSEIDCCCDNWREKLYDKLACKCWYRNCVFWTGCDWDLVVNSECLDEKWNYFLCANKVYEFNNLTIEEWATIRFEWQWVPIIRVRGRFINNWVIDMRWWACTWACCFVDDVSWATIQNSSCNWSPCAWWTGWASAWDHCYWDPWAWKTGCNWTATCWWAWWDACSSSQCACCGCPADWLNGWAWWHWWWRTYSGWWWGGGWWWWWRYWNGWTWWTWWNYEYWYESWNGWSWGNSWNFWTWWTWWWSWWSWSSWWAGWKWFIWWKWWNWLWNWWNGWDWVLQGWTGWNSTSICGQVWWTGWNAINNMFWLLLSARIFNNADWVICSKGWNGWDWWNWTWSNCNTRFSCWWHGWNWADWGCVVIVYWNSVEQWNIDIQGWNGWLWWRTYASTYQCQWQHREASWSNGCAWSFKICRFTY